VSVLALPRPAAPRRQPLPAHALAGLATTAARRLARSWAPPTLVPTGRWHVRLRLDEDHDVWLLGWGPGAGIDLHDHGDAAGALSVVHGRLVEHRAAVGAEPTRRVVHPSEVATFALGDRHGVENPGRAAALSVHVYSPPLSSMSFYDERGSQLRQEAVDLPALSGELHPLQGRMVAGPG
jgi:hypothetical protein